MNAQAPGGDPIASVTCKHVRVILRRDATGSPWVSELAAGELINSEKLEDGFLRAWGVNGTEAVGGQLPPGAATVELADRFGRKSRVLNSDGLWLAKALPGRRRPIDVIYRYDTGDIMHAEMLLQRSRRISALHELLLRLKPVRARGSYTYRDGR